MTVHVKKPTCVKTDKVQVKEGRIEQGSELWAQLSERDQRKRLNSIKEVNLKLKSSNFFISPTRLRMMNVPIAWDNNQLKVCCIKAVRERATQAEPKVSQVWHILCALPLVISGAISYKRLHQQQACTAV